LQGIITWFDNFSVLLRRDGHTQLVYKHAISTVMPSGPVQLFEPDKKDEDAGAGAEADAKAGAEAGAEAEATVEEAADA